MDRDALRSGIQQQAVDLWAGSLYSGYCLISMGVGKSRIMAMAINRYLADHPGFDYQKYDFPILVVVNSSTLRDKEIPTEFKKWKVTVKVKTVCYQTAYRWEGKRIGLLLTDEMDFAITEGERYLQLFHRCSYDAWLGLTGTLIQGKEEATTALFKKTPFMEFSLASAQQMGLVNKTEVWIHEVPLFTHATLNAPYGEVSKYRWITRKITQLKQEISQAYDWLRLNKPVSYQDGMQMNERLSELKSKKEFWESRPSNPNNRMLMMHSADSLCMYARLLKDMILRDSSNKVIIFAELTTQVDQIACYCYHGKKSDDDVIEQLNSGEISELGVVRKVNRGVNFTGLNHAIIHSYTSSVTNATQAYIGRMVRLDPDQTARIHFLVSYYTENGEKVYCQNYNWVSSIFSSRELEHLELKYYDAKELLNYLK